MADLKFTDFSFTFESGDTFTIPSGDIKIRLDTATEADTSVVTGDEDKFVYETSGSAGYTWTAPSFGSTSAPYVVYSGSSADPIRLYSGSTMDKLRELHCKVEDETGESICQECGYLWPCRTAELLD